jgi:hypothetical protein
MLVDVDFSADAKGNKIPAGAYVETEWTDYGLTLSAAGGFGTLPRVFDTANPAESNAIGDPDLGAPNEECSPPGPGVGVGGGPDNIPGANCSPLGNALIVQEKNDAVSIPDDNVDGGMLVFDFNPKATYVKDIGLLDVDNKTSIIITYMLESGETKEKTISVPLLGDNSYQLLSIDTENVVQLVVSTRRSAAVTSITFCHPEVPTSPPAETPPPTLFPTPELSMSMSMSMPIEQGPPIAPRTAAPTASQIGSPTASPIMSPTG